MATDELTDLFANLTLPAYSPRASEPVASEHVASAPTTPVRLRAWVGPAYVVFVGRETGVYRTWSQCFSQTQGVPHSSLSRYPSFAAAERAYSAALDRGLVCTGEQRAADTRRVVERQKLEPEDLPLCLHFLEDPTSKAMAQAMKSRWYVVYKGRQPGVYLTYHECSYSTSGYAGAAHESFNSRAAAITSLECALEEGRVYKFVLQ